MDKTYIAYYRVSTTKQGRSGLGLEAQQADVMRFTNGNILAAYTEVESGGNNTRPKLKEALAHCKQANATLLIAKLDRLSRNVLFIETLKAQGVKFCCCDMPEANEFVIGIMAQLAQYERKVIGDRIKAALKAAKARGKKLGGSKPEHCKTMRESRKTTVINPNLSYIIENEYNNGKTFAQIAEKVNKLGYTTSRGNQHNATSIYRIYQKIKKCSTYLQGVEPTNTAL